VVGPQEYGYEVARAVEFLRTEGRSLADAIVRSRDRLSEEMQFEEAARQHKRLEKVEVAMKSSDALAREIGRLNGVAITRSSIPDSVEIWFVREGEWVGPSPFNFGPGDGKMVSLDQKLRDLFANVAAPRRSLRERQEYLALLARWFYSSWRDGEWLPFETYEEIPYRKLVNAVSRVAHG
jgi:excinuclease UvrABC nuclease subunit